ncbi:hypothetical protein K8W59_01635 [Nocardioides rotundus]|nr:hypothetical protein [Nocardioides rotundus]UAL30275.1 hypothetical protein K8W59_01635 [Nocardioides rotundus]
MFPIDQYVFAEDAYRRERARESWRAVRPRRHRRTRRPGGPTRPPR